MKKIIFSVLFCVHLNCFAGAADAAVGVATAIGIGAAMSATAASGLAPYESVYWADPRLKSTTKLSEQCGMLVETKIYSMAPFSIMFLGLKNNSNLNTQVFNNQATVTYNNDTTRYFDLDLNGAIFFPPKTISATYFKFHQKSDFKGAATMQIKIPVNSGEKSCEILVNYVKNPDLSSDENSVDSEVFTLGFYFGPSLLQGGVADLTDKGTALSFKMEMNTIGAANHGMYLDFGFTSINASTAYVNAHPLLEHKEWSLGGFGLGYLHRTILDENRNIYLKVGAEFGNMRIGSYKDAFTASSKYIAANLGLRYNTMFSNVERGLWRGKYYYNIGINSIYIPTVEFDSQKSSGFNHSLLFGISVGI